MLPSQIVVFGFSFYTASFFYLFALILFIYVVWREARREGFDDESVFDMTLFVLIFSVFAGRVSYLLNTYTNIYEIVLKTFEFWIPGVDYLGFVIGVFVSMSIWIRNRRWSFFRIVDIFSMGFSIALCLVLVPEILIGGRWDLVIAFGLLVFVHALMLKLRRGGFVFGGLFGLFLMSIGAVFPFFFKDGKSLIFFPLLFTLGVLTLFKRVRSSKMKVLRNFSEGFLNSIKDLLVKKDKELAKEESLIKKSDPYNTPDRNVVANEDVEGAAEDAEKEKIDILAKSVMEMRMQIRKALAKINIGTYGICEICHKPIDEARLKAFPQATTCTSCASKSE